MPGEMIRMALFSKFDTDCNFSGDYLLQVAVEENDRPSACELYHDIQTEVDQESEEKNPDFLLMPKFSGDLLQLNKPDFARSVCLYLTKK